MISLLGLVKPLAGYMAAAVALGVAGHLAASLITVLGGLAILDVLKMNPLVPLKTAFAAAVLFAVLRGALRYGEQTCNHYIAFRLLALLRDRVFSALRRLCPAKLDGRSKGNLVSVITSDIELLEVFYAHTVSPFFIAVIFCGIQVFLLSVIHPLLGIYAAVSYLLVGAAVPLFFSAVSGDDGIRFRTGSGRLSGYVLDSLRGMDEILQFGVQEERLREMDRMSDALNRESRRMKRKAGADTASVNALILLLDLGMMLISAGLCGFRESLVSVLLFMSSFGPAVALAALGTTLQNTFAAGNRVLDLLEESPVTEDISGMPQACFGTAEMNGVSFRYGDEPVLSDVTLSVPSGKIVGISGKSGSGKSTLLKLLMRFYDPDRGTVSVAGRTIREINTEDLRNMESFMSQSTYLYRDSIRRNLLLACPDATEEEMVDACRRASVHDFIMKLPDGYDTEVGELGGTLSGGERQRIGLARAFLHRSDLLLLDEPTSSLDSLNEAVILRSLHENRNGRTSILVSHRPSTMAIADRVYTVENGGIRE